jgi:hypothetical protein
MEEFKPTLLFKAVSTGKTFGIYYLPQYGVVMDGVNPDGSSRTVAHTIASCGYEIVPVEVDPEPDEDGIIQAISDWMRGGEEEPEEEDDFGLLEFVKEKLLKTGR